MKQLELEQMIRTIVEQVVRQLESRGTTQKTGCCGNCETAGERPPSAPHVEERIPDQPERRLISGATIAEIAGQGQNVVRVGSSTIITPLARDEARARGIRFDYSPRLSCITGAGRSEDRSPQLFVLVGSGLRREEKLLEELGESAGFKVTILRPAERRPRVLEQAATEIAEEVLKNPGSRGLILGGDAFSLSFHVTRLPGIRPVVCWDSESACESRKGCDTNILLLNDSQLGLPMIRRIVEGWLKA